MLVRRLLHRYGYRFRLHRTDLPGRPDIVLGVSEEEIGCIRARMFLAPARGLLLLARPEIKRFLLGT